MKTGKEQQDLQQEVAIADKWIKEKYGDLKESDLLKLLLYKLDLVEQQNKRINSIL